MNIPRSVLPIALVGIFFALTFAVHHKAFTAPPQYDSAYLLKDNEYLFNVGLAQVINIFPQRPVPMITFYINYLASGINPCYFRVVNAFLMACAAGVVVLLLKYILEIPGITVHGTASQKRMVSIGLGLVFLLHPTTIYVVVYVWQRTALMSGLFFFLALAAYLATRTGRIPNVVVGYAACAAMFLLAIASKENAIALPVILLLAELALFNASLRDLLKRSVVIGSVVLIALLALSFVERPHGNMLSHGGILKTIARYYEESGLTLAQVAMGQCVVFFEYLKMLVVPLPSNVHLISAQLIPSSITELPVTAPAIAGVVAITCFAGIGLLRRRPLVGFGTLFVMVSLLPEALVVPQYLFFGYRVFVPMFGLLLIAADGILFLIDLPQSGRCKLAMKMGLTSALMAAILLLSYATVSKEALWMDPIAFWKDVYERLPRNDERVEKHARIQALNNLGYHLQTRGETQQAIELHRKAMQVDRRIAYTYICLGAAYAHVGQVDDAAATYRELLRIDQNNSDAHAGLAAVLLKQNKLDEALEHFKRAEELKPGHPGINYGMATVWLMKNDYSSAMPYLQRTIESDPNHVEAHYNIGKILTDAGKTAEAIDHFNKALAVDPKFWMAHNNLGVIFATTGRLSEAIDHFRAALKINPDDVPTQKNLETALATLGSVNTK
ncbi:MAG: tetratricopeptide repeat protein [Desulfomonilaceae bacterium]